MAFVLITGASSGLGEALAREYAHQGRDLLLVARRGDRLQKLQGELAQVRVELMVADVTDPNFGEALRKKCEEFPVDTVYCNAGFNVMGSFTKLSLADFRRQFETNVFGVIQTAKASLPSLTQTKGRLVLIGSLNSYLAFPLGSPYATSKFMVRALAESLYSELHGAGISVSLICPGPVESEILSINNRGVPVEVERGRLPQPMMKGSRAAQIIIKAVEKRKREVFLRSAEHLVIAIQRHFPSLTLWVMQKVFTAKRTQIEKMVSAINPDAF